MKREELPELKVKFRSDDKHLINKMAKDYGQLVGDKKDREAARVLTEMNEEIRRRGRK